jgi:hypothetical protein
MCSNVILFIFLLHFASSSAYFITVDAHAEECFFDKVEAGTKMGELHNNPTVPYLKHSFQV